MEKKYEPLYRRVYNDLVNKIKDEQWRPGEKLPTEEELAQTYGVSRITITHALNDLKDMNLIYRIKKSGTFVNGKVNMPQAQLIVPIILPFEESMIQEIVDGAQRLALSNNTFTPIYDSKNNIKKEREILNIILSMKIDGLIVYPCASIENLDLYVKLKQNNIPLCFLDRRVDGIEAPLITSDNQQGMFELVNHLIRSGHRRIGFFGINDAMISTEKERFIGYCNALIYNKIPLRNEYIFKLNDLHTREIDIPQKKQSEIFEHYTHLCIQSFLALKEKPSVLCCINDICGITFIRLGKEYGLNFIDDVMITGFDNLQVSYSDYFKFTTVKQDFKTLGSTAIQTILDILQGKKSESLYRIPAKLIIRNS